MCPDGDSTASPVTGVRDPETTTANISLESESPKNVQKPKSPPPRQTL